MGWLIGSLIVISRFLLEFENSALNQRWRHNFFVLEIFKSSQELGKLRL